MLRDFSAQYTAYDLTVPLVHGYDFLGCLATLWLIADRSAQLGIKTHCQFCLGTDAQFDSMASIVDGHALLRPVFSRAQEHIGGIVRFWVVVRETGRDDRNPSIDALAATAAVPLCFRFEHRMGARAGIGNQVRGPIGAEACDHLRFCLEEIRVVHDEIAACDLAAKGLQREKSGGMRGARCARPNDLVGNRKVQTDDAVFKEPYATRLNQFGHDGAKCRI